MAIGGKSSSPAAPAGRQPGGASSLRRPAFVAAATAAIVLAAAAAAALVVRGHLIDTAQTSFETRAAHVTADVRRELAVCTQVMRGASGFIAAQTQAMPNGQSAADAWDRYIARLDLDDAPPCVRTLGYAEASSGAIAAVGDAGANANANATSAASTPLARIVLMWPQRGDPAAGHDFGISAATRAALLRAADTAQAALAVRAVPREAEAESEQPENATRARVDLYLPVYRNAPPSAQPSARRAALTGFVLARLDTEYLFASVAAHEPRIELHVAAGRPPMALYPPGTSLAQRADHAPRFNQTDTTRFGGETFTLTYGTSDPSLTAAADFSGTTILAAGLFAALVAGGAAFMFERKRGTTLAEAGIARSLSMLNEARMMAIIRSSKEAIITIDESQRIVIFNPMAEQVFGCSAMDAIGSPIERFIPERFRKEHSKHVERFGETGVTDRRMGRQRVLFGVRANGQEFPIEASISQIRDSNGKLYTVMLRDVTERVKVDDELKRSREELRELSANLQNVREEEKTRIARELHDDLGQQLTALKMDLSSVEQALEGGPAAPPVVLSQLRGMRRLIDTTVGSVRRIAADLRPVMLDDLGLLPAIEWLVNDFTTRYGIEVERRIEPGDVFFSRNGATTLFRIMQEALTNVARHAEATRVAITLAVEGEQCVVRIADNGRGAAEPSDTEGHGEKSFGLLGIRERAHILGGSVSIETAARRGFAITVVLPRAAIQQEEALP